jgi:hypothetical protein
MQKIHYCTLALVLIALSCNSTRVSSSWSAKNYTAPVYQHLLVWGILSRNDSTLRYQMEHHLVGDLRSLGYTAYSSMDVMGNQAFDRIGEKEVVARFMNSGVDAIITIVLLDRKKESDYKPGHIEYKPVTEYEYLEKYYTQKYIQVYTPGYYQTTTRYFWESNLYDLRPEKLVYAVRTRSFNPSSTTALAHENGLQILKDMIQQKILHNKATDD